jgi:glycosyltransferase involved in cell wall biosynthesis
MPTRGRQELSRAAIECFLAQTYSPRELVIVDDVDARSFPDGVSIPHVVYECLPERLQIGGKRNHCCRRSIGEIIVHWDSDDWSAPGRIEDQVTRLIETGKLMTGYSSMQFTDGERWWEYTGDGRYILGTSFCYRKALWEMRNFPDVILGEDLVFQQGVDVAAVPPRGLMFARNHNGNCGQRNMRAPQWRELKPEEVKVCYV